MQAHSNDLLFGDIGRTPSAAPSKGMGSSPATKGYPSAGPASGQRTKERAAPVKQPAGPKSLLDDPDRPYFVARMNDQGVLDHTDKEKQFIIPVDSEVRFHLDCGTGVSRGARLLVNKPKPQPNGGWEYTITQPLTNEEVDEDVWAGSELDSQYLEVVDADPEASQYYLEFRVLFDVSGSFFVQIVYEDESNSGGVTYTKP